MGPLVLMGGCGFSRHGPLRVLGVVVVVENGSNLVLFCFYFLFFLIGVYVYGFDNGGY